MMHLSIDTRHRIPGRRIASRPPIVQKYQSAAGIDTLFTSCIYLSAMIYGVHSMCLNSRRAASWNSVN